MEVPGHRGLASTTEGSRWVRLLAGAMVASCAHASAWDRAPERKGPVVCKPYLEPSGGKVEPWLTTDPPYDNATALPDEFVAETRLFDAIDRLERESFVVLTAAEIAYFGDSTWRCPTPRRTILVRGVLFWRGTGGFRVYEHRSGVLEVEHGSLGHSVPPPERQPILVCVAAPPTEVCVSAGVAE